MENYEINVLKRNGDWKKYNQNDVSLSLETNTTKENVNSNSMIEENINSNSMIEENINTHSLSYINEVSSIINKLENIENEKSKLKVELKKYEKIFQSKKIVSTQQLSQISKEIEMFDKAIGIIKNLKDF